jgi:hypothetical protein
MTTLVTNNAFATLSANINAASSTLTVQTGEGARFPSPGAGEQAFITLIAAGSGAVEIIKYTSRSGDSFTGLTRGSDNTTAQSFTAGDAVELRVVAATYHPDGILPNQTGHSGKFLKSVSLTAQWTQITNTDVSGLGTLATQNGTFSGTSSGTNTGDQTITLTGNVTGSGTGSFVATIAANAVTFAKMVQIATARFLGRVTAGSGNIEELTAAQVKTALNYTASDVSGLALVATTGNAGDLTGTLSTAQLPALSGDVSTAAGSGVTAIGANKVTLGQMAQVASSTVLGRSTASTGNVEVLAALPAAVLPAYTGDVTKPAGSTATTIANNVVSLAKMAQVAASVFLGRVTAGSGNVEALTAAQAKTILGITGSDITGLAPIATSGSASDLTTGTVPAARVPAFTGDVTNPVGTVATTIAANAVSLAKMAQIATARFLGRATAATGNVEELTAAQAKTVLAITSSDVSGLGSLATQSGTFSGTHSGDSSGTNTGDQTITLTGDVTGTGTGSFAATIGANKVTLAQMAQVATARFLGRVTAATGNVEALTSAQMKTALAIAAADVTGLATIATTGSASNLVAGTVPAAQMPAHTGDVTSAAGAVALTIAANAVTLAKMANISQSTMLGRVSAGGGLVEMLTAAQTKTLLAIAQADVSGLTTGSAPTFAGVTLTGNLVAVDVVPSGNVRGQKTVYFTQQTVGTTTGAVAVDFATGQKQKLTTTGNVTALTFSFPGAGHYQLVLVSGANTVAFPAIGASFQWLGATAAPTLNTGTYGGVLNLFYDGSMTLASYTKIGAA